jgi:hypothetical protein
MSQSRPNPVLDEFQADDAELAQQLLNLRQEPAPALQQRIQAIPHKAQRLPRLDPRLAWGSAAVLLVLLLFASPPAKAMLGEVEKIIGRIHLTIMEVLPGRTEPIVIESTPISLSEAQLAVPFEFIGPEYLPAGLNPKAKIYVVNLDTPIAKMRWRDASGGFVQLSIHQANIKNTRVENLIGSESSEPILINGQEGVIIYGGWDEVSRIWRFQDRVTTLIWEINGIQYNLLSYSTVVDLTELIAMAQSVE